MEYEIISKKDFEKIRKEYYSQLNDFERRLFDNLDLLIDRVNKLKILKPGTLDYWTYYDAILVQIRAMFIETPKYKDNHTFQNYLKKIDQYDIANEIDDYLNTTNIMPGLSLREAIKVSVDKFIAHCDRVNDEDIIIEHSCRDKITGPNNQYSIGNVLVDFMKIILKGGLKAWSDYYTNKPMKL